MVPLATDWSTVSAMVTGVGTLVLVIGEHEAHERAARSGPSLDHVVDA